MNHKARFFEGSASWKGLAASGALSICHQKDSNPICIMQGTSGLALLDSTLCGKLVLKDSALCGKLVLKDSTLCGELVLRQCA
jgi:hypothetical protein